MVKHLFKGVLILSLIAFINPISASDTVDVNSTKTSVFEMSHSVSRESFFKTIVENATINEAGQTKLGSFIVRNNTRDGFELSIESAAGGNLESATTDDGEQPIPYSIALNKTGTVGTGITYTSSFSDAELSGGGSLTVLARPGTDVQSATDATFELFVDIDQSQSDALNLAGTYSDTITLTYTDK